MPTSDTGEDAGVGIYALLLGLGYRWLFKRALRQPLWWIWLPFLGMIALKAECSVSYMVNWVVKAVLVMGLVIWACPALRAVLSRNRPPRVT